MENKSLNTTEYIKMIKESPEKKKGYAYAIITAVVAIALIVLAIRPTVVKIVSITSEIKENKRLSTVLDTKISTLSNLDTQYQEVGDQLENLQLIFPANGNFSLLMANISSVLSRNGFYLNGISFDEYQENDYNISTKYLVPWNMRLSIKGKDSNLINMLKELEALPMYPVIEGISYSGEKDNSGLTNYSINLRIYKIENVNFYD